MKKIIILCMCLMCFTGCSKDTTSGKIENIKYKETDKITTDVKLEMNNGDLILMELYPDVAPITVENFQSLVNEKFYDGIIFHRVVANFMIQAGDPTGIGTGGSENTIKGEFSSNGVENNLSHERGVISMARSKSLDSASSQFFIVQNDSTFLDGDYAAFGRVIAGMNVVDRISNLKTDGNDKPYSNQVIKSIRFIEIEEK